MEEELLRGLWKPLAAAPICETSLPHIDMTRLLPTGFLRSSTRFADRPAIAVAGREISYRDLARRAMRVAATIQKETAGDETPLTAVFAYRSETAYAGVLGALQAGHGYVPLNRTFPVDRTRLMLERAMCEAVVIDKESLLQIDEVLRDTTKRLLLICPDLSDVTELAARFPIHRVMGADDLLPPEQWTPREVSFDSIAYLLFTSGSTGQPKGVMVSHRNVVSYVDFVAARYGIQEHDRCSQLFDMTFDLSAHDMFVAWERGACVCCATQKEIIKPGAFIKDAGLTTWFSVPSTAIFMKKLGMLKPAMYPCLRLSLFCGEALPVEVTKGWAEAAPNSIIENIYGPTELTIACTAYRWDNGRSPGECEHGVVPIGYPFAGMEVKVADDSLHEVEPGQDGELLMTGPQLSLGYWQDAERTAAAFVTPPGSAKVFYRTGDRVRRPAGSAPLIYLGRMDHQIKIMGHRVELGEVEAAIREESGIDGVVALGWPITPGGAGAVEAFLQTTGGVDAAELQQRLESRLPKYMVPRRLHAISELPLNSNGKYDRRALLQKLQETS